MFQYFKLLHLVPIQYGANMVSFFGKPSDTSIVIFDCASSDNTFMFSSKISYNKQLDHTIILFLTLPHHCVAWIGKSGSIE